MLNCMGLIEFYQQLGVFNLQKLPATHRAQRRHRVLQSEHPECNGEIREERERDG